MEITGNQQDMLGIEELSLSLSLFCFRERGRRVLGIKKKLKHPAERDFQVKQKEFIRFADVFQVYQDMGHLVSNTEADYRV